MSSSLRHLALLAGLALFTAGCSDSTGTDGDALSPAEAAFLADEFTVTALDGLSSALSRAPAAAALASPPITFTRTVSYSRDCQGGGTVSVTGSMTGTLDSETRSGTVSVANTMIITDCVKSRGDLTFTLNTDPSLDLSGEITIENGQRSGGTFAKIGAFRWEASDGRSGRCAIDLSITWAADGSRSVTGTVCGRAVNRSS